MQRVNQRKQSPEDANFLSDTMRNCKLDLFNQLFLFLQELRVGSFDLELADKFQVSNTTVSRIIITWTNFLYFTLGSMPIWPSRGKIQENMPTVFKDLYPQCRGILDASEIKIQAPSPSWSTPNVIHLPRVTQHWKGMSSLLPLVKCHMWVPCMQAQFQTKSWHGCQAFWICLSRWSNP